MAPSLGIMVTRYLDLEHIAGITRAARKAGHPVQIFMTDEGVRCASDPRFLELLVDGVEIAACEHLCEKLGIRERTRGINYSSQFDNAGMLHRSEKILVL